MSSSYSFPVFSKWADSPSTSERFYCLTAQPGLDFQEEARNLLAQYDELCGGDSSELMLRFHVSDVTRQVPMLQSLLGSRQSYVSYVGQPPANGARLALEAWHIDGAASKQIHFKDGGSLLTAQWSTYTMLLIGKQSLKTSGSYRQMREEFDWLDSAAATFSTTVPDLIHRTWIYCRDIDNNYPGLVTGRNEKFQDYQLTPETHYIASTGIEGQSDAPNRLIRMDSWGQIGQVAGQIEYMEALDHLSPTHVYNVAFERGTRIIYGDRSRYYISGTASIDAYGNILHEGDVAQQTRRTLENINALMTNHRGSLSDLKQAVVYLRDWSDLPVVSSILADSPMHQVPLVIVKAPVCRPGWLVEIDAIGLNSCGDPSFHPLN